MAGLVAAARLRELGAEPVVQEKGDRVGGSMLGPLGYSIRMPREGSAISPVTIW